MVLKSHGEIELMHAANGLVHQVLDHLTPMVEPGVSTRELDQAAEKVIRDAGAVPAFLNYRGFPATLCTSINDVIVHGIPDETTLADGDIIGIDCGVLYKGYYGDAARTYAVGRIDREAQSLLDTTRRSLELAIEAIQPGGRVSDIGAAVQKHVEAHGFSVVRDFVGHGIGAALHEEPQVPNFGRPARDRCSRPVWCWRSSRWSTPAARASRWTRTAGQREPTTVRYRRTSSSRWR